MSMPFVQESYDRNDALGKGILSEFLRKRGLKVPEGQVEDYGSDLKAYRDNKEITLEVEMKQLEFSDSPESFSFPTISFLGRKRKYGEFWYVIISSQGDGLIMCHSKDIFKDEYKEEFEINTDERNGVDVFYRVPKCKCKFYKYE